MGADQDRSRTSKNNGNHDHYEQRSARTRALNSDVSEGVIAGWLLIVLQARLLLSTTVQF